MNQNKKMPPMNQDTNGEALTESKLHQKKFNPIPEKLDVPGKLIVDAAYTVYKNLGPGLLERVYVLHVRDCHELTKRWLSFQRQINIPVVYDNLVFDEGLRLDVLVENEIICELGAS